MSNIINGKEAVEGMMRGVTIVTDLIRPTYGGGGTNVVVESNLNPGHLIANDAQTIVQAIKVKEPAEKRGVAFIQELCEKADKVSGDARKTTIILAEEILKEGYKADINKLELKRELDALIPVIETEIDEHTRQITVDAVGAVATTASESVETGKLLQEIYQKIGKNGIIHPQGSGTYETSYKFIDGVRFDMTGFLSPAMVHDEQARKDKVKETKAIYEQPLILVTKKKITTDEDINPLLKEMMSNGDKDLVIFTQDMDSGVASMLIDLHQSNRFNILIIKAPVLWQNYVFEDFAKCVGATIVEDATGLNFKNLKLSHLGTCEKLIVDQEETILIGTKDIFDHIKYLQEKGDDDSKLRLSWLTNKTVILKLGANSETDLSYKRLKTHDAIRSSELALKYGVVPGGGYCLYSVATLFTSQKPNETPTQKIIKHIMLTALRAPHHQLCQNMGVDMTDFDGLFFKEDIIDASQVIKNAVRNAIGIASTILTANGLVYIPEKTPLEMQYEMAMNKNHAF